MKHVYALAAVLLTALAARADITVTGEGKITVVPDLAHVSVGVVTEDKTAAEAVAANNAAMKALFQALQALGIAERDVQTVAFTITAKYPPPDTHPFVTTAPRLLSYTVTNQIVVTVRKVDDTGKVVDSLVKEGANRVDGISFGISDTHKLMDEARKAAVGDARHKAELYAHETDVRLGSVLQISENGISWPALRSFSKEELTAVGVPLARGEMSVTATVTVVYAIAGQK
jgi:uncharacterized protein YggE